MNPIDDAYIYQAGDHAAETRGTIDPEQLRIRQSVASAQYTRNAYIMFDISSQPGPFSNVRIQLYADVPDEKQMDIYYCDTNWTEETLTGNNRPPGSFINSTRVEIGEGYVSWDVTIYVNQARSSGQHKVSFIIMDVAGAESTIDTKWHSKENPSGNAPRLILTAGDPPEVYYGSYYIDQVSGNDDSTGHSPEQAWKTLANIENVIFQPGDSLLFKSGCEWTGTFSPKGSGQPGKPFVIGKYGGEKRPVIHGNGLATNTITFRNQHHIELRDLAITNLGPTDEFKRGVYYHGTDMGEIRYLVFDNLEVYDVNGTMTNKHNGGIFLEITGTLIPTWFDTLIVSNCHIHDVNRTGVSFQSEWRTRERYDDGNWTPSYNVHIHHNTFENTGANALIVRVSHNPVMEYNLFHHCSIHGSGNASFSFNTDSAIWQYNEARYTVYNTKATSWDGTDDNDAGGFDSDYRSRNTIIQYNYSHDNGYGGVLLTGGPGSGTGFNTGTIIRYNVFANNDHHGIRVSGNVPHGDVYNNVFIAESGLENNKFIWHKSWGGSYADSMKYWNNIFYNEGTNTVIDLGGSTNNEFRNNLYFGESFSQLPVDPYAVLEDPMMVNPLASPDGYDAIYNYMLKAGSPAIDRGCLKQGAPSRDIAGNVVPFGTAPDIGIFEWIIDTFDVVIVVKDELGNEIEGASVWLEGKGNISTNLNGEALFTDVSATGIIPVNIEYQDYPLLSGSLELTSDDTVAFTLSKSTYDLNIIISSESDILLENAVVTIPGIDTLTTNNKGEAVFTAIAESENLPYRVELEGYHSVTGETGHLKVDTVKISLDARSISLEFRDMDNSVLKDVIVDMGSYGTRQSDTQGNALFEPVTAFDTVYFTAEKPGFIPLTDSLIIGENDVYHFIRLEKNTVQLLILDNLLLPVASAAVVINEEIRYSDVDGLVEYSKIPLNEYITYSVYQTGFQTKTDSILLTGTGELIYVILELPVRYSVTFQVNDKHGMAIEDAMVTLSGYGIYMTDSTGKATFNDVLPDEDLIYSVMATGYRDTVNILDVTDQDVTVNINMYLVTGKDISPATNNSKLIVYPNPASGFVKLHPPGKKGKLEVFDIHGRTVFSKDGLSGLQHLETRNWKAGVYFIYFNTDDTGTILPVKLMIIK